MFDVIIVGGSYAGLSAALQIARARRTVLVIDAGMPRNRFAHASHGFLGQDGRQPAAITADARAQLGLYMNAVCLEGTAIRAGKTGRGFSVTLASGQTHEARRLVLASGVIDELPDIPGLRERWGRSVFHCPYCHGYELNNGRLGVLATGPHSMHQAMLIPDWGSTTLFTNGAFEPDPAEVTALAERGVMIERNAVAEVAGERADVKLHGGRTVSLDGLFTTSRIKVANPLAQQLGCAFEDGPLGSVIQTDAMKETTIADVFACGDTARAAGSVTFAVSDGAMAGLAAHRSLVFPR